jgi:uncharacterized protein (TIGR03066 family)
MKATKKPQAKQAAPRPPQTARGSMRLIALVGVFLLAGGAAWAFAELVVWNRLPADLVGKWVVEGGEQDGATFDFHRNGTMVGRINLNGREGIVQARVEVDGNKLYTTTTNPNSGRDETRTQTIKTLTNRSLVLVDKRGQELTMSRAE